MLMEAAPKDEIRLADVALLTDRIRLAEGQKQLYGSQVEFRDGQWVVRPTEDPANTDQRRARMGLPPMEEYLQTVRKTYESSNVLGERRTSVPR